MKCHSIYDINLYIKFKINECGTPEIVYFLKLNCNYFSCNLAFHKPISKCVILTQDARLPTYSPRAAGRMTRDTEFVFGLYALFSLRNSVGPICVLTIYSYETFIFLWQHCAPNSEQRHKSEKGNVMVLKWKQEKRQNLHEVSKGFYPCKSLLCVHC